MKILLFPIFLGMFISFKALMAQPPLSQNTVLDVNSPVQHNALGTLKVNPSSLEPLEIEKLKTQCQNTLHQLSKNLSKNDLYRICNYIKHKKGCYSVNNRPIIHYNRRRFKKKGKRILALSLIHGDEFASGAVTAQWIKRLHKIRPRNSWRVIPLANPDGWVNKTRMNENRVDINRNFPSEDWDKYALKWWTVKKKKDPRRYPGPSAASEPETRCLMAHIEEFKPDFIISIHTPLGVLDFDGPKNIKPPKYLPLPWKALGNYPGSLGRYMWKDNKVPVLTIELQGSHGVNQLEKFDRLQDISGIVAIRAHKILKKKLKNKKQKEETPKNDNSETESRREKKYNKNSSHS